MFPKFNEMVQVDANEIKLASDVIIDALCLHKIPMVTATIALEIITKYIKENFDISYQHIKLDWESRDV